MKKYKSYIIMGIVIALLAIGYLVISNIDTEKPVDEYEKETETLYSIPSSDIASINIKNEYGEYTVLYGDEIKIEGKDIEIDTDKLSNILTEMSIMFATNKAAENVDDLSSYGLDNPSETAVITEKNGNKTVLSLGNKTPSGYDYYATVNNGKTVYIISEYSCNALTTKLDYYRNSVLFDFESNNVKTLSFTKRNKPSVTFIKNEVSDTSIPNNVFAAYSMKSPHDWDAEVNMVTEILNTLLEAEINSYVEDNPKDLSKYGLTSYYAKITVTQKDGKINEITVGNNVDGYCYVKIAGKDAVYSVKASTFDFVDREPTSFLQQFAFIRNLDTIKTIEYFHGDVNAVFDVKKIKDEVHDIKYNGKNISEDTFKELYTELISLKYAGVISASKSGEPVLKCKFTYTNGKSETAEYYRYDDRKIALCVNGKIQFYVDSSELNVRTKRIDEIIKNKF